LIDDEVERGSVERERGGTEVSSRHPAGTHADFFEDEEGFDEVEEEREGSVSR